MKHDKVGSVMTGEVVRAVYETSFEEVARLLEPYQISGLPMVDDDEKVIGVVSESDLLVLQPDVGDGAAARSWFRWSSLTGRTRTRESKAQARDAGQLERRSEIPLAVRLTRHIDGVVAVEDRLSYRFDDSRTQEVLP